MFQFLVSFNEAYADLDAFFAEGPTWLMRGTVVGVPA